jgi:hypothetical protein
MLAKHCGAARFAYNWGLARKAASYKLTGKSPSATELHRELNSLKKTDFPWLYEVSKCAPQEALRNLDRAYANFFRRCELKRKNKLKVSVGFPRFKSRKRGLGSFRLTGSIKAEEAKVKLPRLGWIRLKKRGYLPSESESIHVLSATVSERAGRWFISLQVSEKKPKPEPASGPPAGVDLGVKTLAVISCSEDEHIHYENPRAIFSGARRLRKLQKKLARQQNRQTALPDSLYPLERHTRGDLTDSGESQAAVREAPVDWHRGPERVGHDEAPPSCPSRGRRIDEGVQKATGVQVCLALHRARCRLPLRGDLQALLQVWLGEAGPHALGANIQVRVLRSHR